MFRPLKEISWSGDYLATDNALLVAKFKNMKKIKEKEKVGRWKKMNSVYQ